MSILDRKCEHGVYNPNRDGAACDQCLSKFRREGRLIILTHEHHYGFDDLVEASRKRRMGRCFEELTESDSDE